jgi:hypothetical protein
MQFGLQTLLLLFVVLWSSLAVFDVFGIAVFIFVLLYSAMFRFLESFTIAKALTGITLFAIAVALLLPAQSRAREGPRLERCVANLARIANALRAYRAEHGCYPPAAVSDRSGKPMHSWRVLILPYLGETGLYDAYDFDQPWNSPKNKELAECLPGVFRCPTTYKEPASETSYVALEGPGAAWNENIAADSDKQLHPERLILLFEVANAGICWIEPRDSTPNTSSACGTIIACPSLESQHAILGHAVAADGRIWRFPREADFALASLIASPDAQVDFEGFGASVIHLPQGLTYSVWTRIAALPIWALSVAILLCRARRSRKSGDRRSDHSDIINVV